MEQLHFSQLERGEHRDPDVGLRFFQLRFGGWEHLSIPGGGGEPVQQLASGAFKHSDSPAVHAGRAEHLLGGRLPGPPRRLPPPGLLRHDGAELLADALQWRRVPERGRDDELPAVQAAAAAGNVPDEQPALDGAVVLVPARFSGEYPAAGASGPAPGLDVQVHASVIFKGRKWTFCEMAAV